MIFLLIVIVILVIILLVIAVRTYQVLCGDRPAACPTCGNRRIRRSDEYCGKCGTKIH